MVIAIAIIVLVVATVLFHFLSPWYFTPIASNWDTVDSTVDVTFWVTGVVFIAVNLFLAYCLIRYRHRKGNKAHYEPENKKLEWWLTGIATENNKLKKFHDDIAAGKYLVLVYVRKHQEATVRKVMAERHADCEMVGVDSHFINPFTSVERVTAPRT